ncbi:MAG TPA: polyprenyl synthetase family protein [Ignavibacteria bacterium]|nr:polyprenyl synthetase family protein [Ignavibacteria bacterium]
MMDSNSGKYKKYTAEVDNRLMEVTGKNDPKLLYEPIKYILSGGGKRIRPVLLIFSCEAFGGKPEDAYSAAVAIEILHNFTLVHDDIMDNADTRRGKETVHKKWDANIAILAGDEMIGLAYKSLSKTKSDRISEIFDCFTDGIIEVCEGQSYDKEFETRGNVSLDEYLMMIGKKTSKLLETCAVVGALIAGADEKQINAMREYANNIGLAFQIQDDLLDIIADEKDFGKKNGGDIYEHKKTYLILKALETATDGNDKTELMKVISNNGELISETDVNKIKAIYKKYGVIEDAKKKIEHYTTKANNYLDIISNEEHKKQLLWFSSMLLSRNF